MDDTYKSSSRTKRSSTFEQFLPCGSPPTTDQEHTCSKTSLTYEAWAVRGQENALLRVSHASWETVGVGFLGLGPVLDGSKRD